jgi:haloalkane dehalogenase
VGELFRTPEERFEELPGYDFEPHWHDAGGLRLHYLDEGEGSPVVCFHGEPTWAYLYRKLVPVLTAAGLRVVCPDYPGRLLGLHGLARLRRAKPGPARGLRDPERHHH